ncbi:MAG: hypothetical protein QME81_09090 [bacterium]|nr:hypothetical protein [bacterium]
MNSKLNILLHLFLLMFILSLANNKVYAMGNRAEKATEVKLIETSDTGAEISPEEMEIIKHLEILENYDLLMEMGLWEDMEIINEKGKKK